MLEGGAWDFVNIQVTNRVPRLPPENALLARPPHHRPNEWTANTQNLSSDLSLPLPVRP